MSVEFSIAQANLKRLVTEYSPLGELSNEAQTRFSFVDRLLQDCLGWPNHEIKVETHEGGDRTDYECGSPRALIVEAKRSSTVLKIPPRSTRTPSRTRLDSLISYSEGTAEAVKQVLTYCQNRGVELAAISNGRQLIVFLATRTDGRAPLSGEAFVFDGYEEQIKGFAQIFDLLSSDAVAEARFRGSLQSRGTIALPQKLSSICVDYYSYNYASDFQENLRNAASLVIEDLGRSFEVERKFLEECYCESGPLSQYSLLGKNILATRYAALFPSGETGSRVEPVHPKRAKPTHFSEKAIGEALARRPLILVGDVGVGKTSFLKRLIEVDAKEQFKRAISVYFDLGSSAALSASTKDAFLNQVEKTIRENLKINKLDEAMINEIYRSQLEEFDTGVMGSLRSTDPRLFAVKRVEQVSEFVSQRETHLRNVLSYAAKHRSSQIVIVIDNADQRSASVQADAFVIAQELSANWDAIVFLALRPQTFHGSKRSGVVSAYPSKVFVIPPPKLEEAIDKRLAFAQRIADGELPVPSASGISLHLESLSTLIGVLRSSLARNNELMEFLVNVSAGNVRLAVELVARFFGNPNVQSEKIVKTASETGDYLVPVHEFARTALLGDYSHFQESSSVASNVFDVGFADAREHFLSLLVLGFLSWTAAASRDTEGFCARVAIVGELQGAGFTAEQVKFHLIRLTRKKLIETAERRTLETDEDTRGELPESFRVTSLGAYTLKRWAGEFAFLEAMAFDTPVFDAEVRAELAKAPSDNRLHTRFARAVAFRDYLSNIWITVGSRPYFDWDQVLASGADSFNRVSRRLVDFGYA